MGKLTAISLKILSLLKTSSHDYCELETVDGPQCLVAKDGSLATILRFNGMKTMPSIADHKTLVRKLTSTFDTFYKDRGHQTQIIFRRDLDATSTLKTTALNQMRTANALRMDVGDLINETTDALLKYVYDESCYFVLWSRPSLLDPIELKRYQRKTQELRNENDWPTTKNAQDLFRPISYLYDRHITFASKIADDLASAEYGCSLDTLGVEEAIRIIRSSVVPDQISSSWSPHIPNPKRRPSLQWKDNDDLDDLSEIMYPTLSSQIMSASGQIGGNELLPDPSTVQIANRVYAPALVEIHQQELKPFTELFSTLNRAETVVNGRSRCIPYSVSFMLTSDGLSGDHLKYFLSAILFFTSTTNRNINDAKRAMSEYVRDGGAVCKLQIGAMTWCDNNKEGIEELALRKSKLIRAIEGWGKQTVIDKTGDPMDGFATNAIGLAPRHIGNGCPAPMYDALYMLPLARPASAFKRGHMLYRSLCGKVLPYQRFSSEQTTWITTISGKPGSGKSVMMNNANFEACLMPGLKKLPYIGIIDIGISSLGFVDLIKDSLPHELQYQVVYKRLQNTEQYAINPFDTSLGLRKPLPSASVFIKNFITTLVTPPERDGKPYTGMTNFVSRVIELAYQRCDPANEKAHPKRYARNLNERLDEAVDKLQFTVKPSTTYWELVDALFQSGYVYEAEIAQRFAVPDLNDLTKVAADSIIKDEYGEMITDGRPLIQTFMVGIKEAITEYPMFRGHTQFDIGSARVVSLDLQDVAIKGSQAATKQTALMYLIARQSFMSKVAYSNEDLVHIPKLYKEHYNKKVSELIDAYKIMCFDEYHKTKGHPMLQEQILTDGREARKWNLEIVLASQILEDFGDITNIATTNIILDAGTRKTQQYASEQIGLSPVAIDAMRRSVNGPRSYGATMLAQVHTKDAIYTQLYTLTLGSMRLWSLSTTAEDRKLRDLMYKRIPDKAVARKLLAEAFPNGSCKSYVESMKSRIHGDEYVDENSLNSVIEQVANRLIERHHTQ